MLKWRDLNGLNDDEYRKRMKTVLKNKKLCGDGLHEFMKGHNFPWSDNRNQQNPKYEKLACLLKACIISIDTFNNWRRQLTPIPQNDFKNLLTALEEATGEKIDPKKISSEYRTDEEIDEIVDALVSGRLTAGERAPIYRQVLKHDEVKESFLQLGIVKTSQLILYFDILNKLDLTLCEFVTFITRMTDEGKSKTKELFSSKHDFDDYIFHVEMSKDLIALKEKIKRNEPEKEAIEYIMRIAKNLGNTLLLQDDDNRIFPVLQFDKSDAEVNSILHEKLWERFINKVDSMDTCSNQPEEYAFFLLRVEMFLYLLEAQNAYLWDWIIHWFRVGAGGKTLAKIKRYYNGNAKYRIVLDEESQQKREEIRRSVNEVFKR